MARKDEVKDVVPMDAYDVVSRQLNRCIRTITEAEKNLRAAKVEERRLRGELARLEDMREPELGLSDGLG